MVAKGSHCSADFGMQTLTTQQSERSAGKKDDVEYDGC